MRHRTSKCAGVVAGLAALILTGLATAAPALDDPTRPPGGALPANSAARSAEDKGLVLESVIISETDRSAIINGTHVKLGGRIGAARLVRVSETEVVVLVGSARRILRLFPGVRKTGAAALHSEAERQQP